MKHIKIFEDFNPPIAGRFVPIGVYAADNHDLYLKKIHELEDAVQIRWALNVEQYWENFIRPGYLFVIVNDVKRGIFIGVTLTPDLKVRLAFDHNDSPIPPSDEREIENIAPLFIKELSPEQMESFISRAIGNPDLLSKIKEGSPDIWKRIQDRMGDDKADTAADLGDLGFY